MNFKRRKHLLQYLFEIELPCWNPPELKIFERHFLSVLYPERAKGAFCCGPLNLRPQAWAGLRPGETSFLSELLTLGTIYLPP
jgi:hypothetical protein